MFRINSLTKLFFSLNMTIIIDFYHTFLNYEEYLQFKYLLFEFYEFKRIRIVLRYSLKYCLNYEEYLFK